jgi:hypothetical protein
MSTTTRGFINVTLYQQISKIYEGAELEILDAIKKSIAKGVDPKGSWYEDKAGSLYDMRKKLSTLFKGEEGKKLKYKLSAGIVKAYEEGIKGATKDFKLPLTPFKGIIPEKIQRMVLEANDLIEGTSVQILRSTLDDYREVVANTSIGVLVGHKTPQEAMKDSLNRFASRGIAGFIDKAGRRWELASYVEMAVELLQQGQHYKGILIGRQN